MQHVMFDIDGTLVESFEFDEQCFTEAVYEVLGTRVDANWDSYTNVTDTGLLMELLERAKIPVTLEQLQAQVKPLFIQKVEAFLQDKGLKPVDGAAPMLASLQARADVCVSIATGGWLETAQLKLAAAGIDAGGIAIASSNDHFRRTDIMQLALERAGGKIEQPPIYFGDALWDLKACDKLGFRFVLVGKRFAYEGDQLESFYHCDVLRRLGLS